MPLGYYNCVSSKLEKIIDLVTDKVMSQLQESCKLLRTTLSSPDVHKKTIHIVLMCLWTADITLIGS